MNRFRATGRLAAAVVVAAAVAAPCAASVFWRSGGRAAQAAAGAAEWPFSDVPVPAALVPSFAIRETADGFSAAAGRSRESARAVAAAMRAALAAGGWEAAAPTGDFDGASFWTRGKHVALASATAAADGDGCVWLLARRPALK